MVVVVVGCGHDGYDNDGSNLGSGHVGPGAHATGEAAAGRDHRREEPPSMHEKRTRQKSRSIVRAGIFR